MVKLTPEEARAFKFAGRAHEGQLRRFTGMPYIVHPRRVGLSIKRLGYQPEMVAAGFLHDVLEDTAVTYPELVVEFGEGVANLVFELTRPEYPKGHLREDVVAYEVERLGGISDAAKTIKCMDIYDNVQTLIYHVPVNWARQYVAEKKLQIPALYVPTDDYPHRIATAMVNNRYARFFPQYA